jgi:protein-tyrosine-phosphatase
LREDEGRVETLSEAGEIATNDVERLEMLAQRARHAVEKLRQLHERLLHPHRRRKAHLRLAEKHIRSVLFLCHGNVYRSPYAAAAFQRALASKRSSASIKVASAGFIAPGRRAPERALSVARARGIDLSSHLSTLLTAQAVGAADLVAVMSEDQAHGIRSRYGRLVMLLILGDLDPRSREGRTIIDPLGADARVVEQVYSRIDRCVEQLAELIANSPRPVQSVSSA